MDLSASLIPSQALSPSSLCTGSTPSQARRQNGNQRNNKIVNAQNTVDNDMSKATTTTRDHRRKASAKLKCDHQKHRDKPVRLYKKKRKPNNKKAWLKYLPEDSDDPITLEPLRSLSYPPFAIVATPPYTPVLRWPIVDDEEPSTPGEQESISKEEKAEREYHKRLKEQWGNITTLDETVFKNTGDEPPMTKMSERFYHLYDGRALAYYLVSQLQFIDPMNRRDLTRDELANLDRYLKRHGFHDINVVEAYDAHGITISNASSAAQTETGRALILQQVAQGLLDSLFTTSRRSKRKQSLPERQRRLPSAPAPVPSRADDNSNLNNSLRDQYARYQNEVIGEADAKSNGSSPTYIEQEGEAYRENGNNGIVIIDDDINPGLRGGLRPVAQESSQYQNAAKSSHDEKFPSLHPITDHVHVHVHGSNKTLQPKAAIENRSSSKSLLKISKLIKTTTPVEAQRQREAREKAWQRNAPAGSKLQPPHSFGTGWARPTATKLELDEMGNELNAANYPDSLIALAKEERRDELLAIERKWKAFLENDKEISYDLKPMQRPRRKFFHEYSDYWKLNTESFGREPKRYIHCVKMADTRMPYPLLSSILDLHQPSAVPQQDNIPIDIENNLSSQIKALAILKDRVPPETPLEALTTYLPDSESELDHSLEDKLGKARAKRQNKKAKKKREKEAQMEKLLLSVFASDDDEESE